LGTLNKETKRIEEDKIFLLPKKLKTQAASEITEGMPVKREGDFVRKSMRLTTGRKRWS